MTPIPELIRLLKLAGYDQASIDNVILTFRVRNSFDSVLHAAQQTAKPATS